MGFDGATVMILVLLLLAVVLVLVFLRYVPLGLWVRALSSGVKVKVSALIGMRLRRISPHRLVDTLIMVRKAGLDWISLWISWKSTCWRAVTLSAWPRP